MKRICVIPARMASKRFPNKPLFKIHGLTIIEHIYHRCKLAKTIDEVYVATCDQEIFDCIEKAGGKAIMTANTHERCTDRVEEAVNKLAYNLDDQDIVLMVQGDEILITPEMLDEMCRKMDNSEAPVINLVCKIRDMKYFDDVNAVKIVSSINDEALYLSRSPIPSHALHKADHVWQQTGIIGFRTQFLKKFSQLSPTPLEKVESVDMLRVLEHGYKLKLHKTMDQLVGVDNLSDARDVDQILSTDLTMKRYNHV